MPNKILSLPLLGYAGYQYYYWYNNPDFIADNNFWIKIIASVAAAVYYLLDGFDFNSIKTLLDNNKKDISQTDENEEISEIPNETDVECLLYLRKRFEKLGTKDSKELFAKIVKEFFQINESENKEQT